MLNETFLVIFKHRVLTEVHYSGETATCMYNSPHETESLARVLPGKLLTLDAQCRRDRGTSACFKDDRVCAQLFCFDAGSGYCVSYRPAAEGSRCGDGAVIILQMSLWRKIFKKSLIRQLGKPTLPIWANFGNVQTFGPTLEMYKHLGKFWKCTNIWANFGNVLNKMRLF